MKLKDLGTFHVNSANNQMSFFPRKRDLKKLGYKPEDLLEFKVSHRKIKEEKW